ncbi:MAG TPA: hypothetical protein VN442_20620 [Bryobacteraceae bacterium]|nr:hypothetical protein [Bryobacteraceae bacterium]
MSFLDSLENSLKALESRDEAAGDNEQQVRRREEERRHALAAAPWAERLRSGPYTAALLSHAVRAGYALRMKVQPTWIDTTLRLEARERRLELRPTPEGVTVVFFENKQETRTVLLDLEGDPAALVENWLGGVKRDG